MNIWTEWKYWHHDSIVKQTIMLLDKSGMRKKPKGGKGVKSENKGSGSKPLTEEQQREAAIKMALEYGIGYNQYKKEVDAIKAARIREKLEGSHG